MGVHIPSIRGDCPYTTAGLLIGGDEGLDQSFSYQSCNPVGVSQ